MSYRKVAVGLSGGVDSAVAAWRLLEQGYEVHSFYIEAYNEPGCRTDQDKKDALKVALQLGIPFAVVDLREAYRREVIEYFLREYEQGRTPNPDMVCNREIKFGLFFEEMQNRGYEYVATGHYARIASVEGRTFLQRAVDQKKDQSYFLAQVTPDKLGRIMFPLGELRKSEVRELAVQRGLVVANKPDSMGICFVGEVDVQKMLAKQLPSEPGEVWLNGHQVGEYQAIWQVTVGQKVGQEMKLLPARLREAGFEPSQMEPLFVTYKDRQRRRIEIGRRESCYHKIVDLVVGQDYVIPACQVGERQWLRCRNLGELVAIVESKYQDARLKLELADPVFAPAPGQIGVIYAEGGKQGDEVVLGWGEIAAK